MDPVGTTTTTTTGQEGYNQVELQVTWHPDLVQDRSSFTCTFCKKGFSNAQALGGHMNIHRRDRARLKELSQQNLQLSLDISKAIPDDDAEDHVSDDSPARMMLSPAEKVDGDGEPDRPPPTGRLALFVEAPSSELTGDHRRTAATVDKVSETLDGVGSVDVDLELRLGPEPQDFKTCR